MTMGAPPLRKTAGPVTLLRTALGGPLELADKVRRVRRTFALVLDAEEVDRRLSELQRQGFIRQRPNRYQLAFIGEIERIQTQNFTDTTQRSAPCNAAWGCHATAKILISLQTIENVDVIFPQRNTGGCGGRRFESCRPDQLDQGLSWRAWSLFYVHTQNTRKISRISLTRKKMWRSHHLVQYTGILPKTKIGMS